MKALSRICIGLGIFLFIAGGVYALTAHEPAGAVQLIVAAITALFVAYVLRIVGSEQADVAPEAEVHVGPTIWPFGFAVAGVLLLLGLIVSPWFWVAGGIAFAISAAGWLRDVARSHAAP